MDLIKAREQALSGELFDDLWVLARSSWNFVSERGKEAIMIDIANIVIAYKITFY